MRWCQQNIQNGNSFCKEQLMNHLPELLALAPPRRLSVRYPETKMFISITVSTRFSEVNESCLAADNSALRLLSAFSSLKFLFTVSSKDKKKKKIHAKKETVKWNKNEPSRKKLLLEIEGVKKERRLFKGLDSLFWTHRGGLSVVRFAVSILTRP